MGKMIQIRNVPEKLHRTLKAKAAQAGLSLSDYILRELKKSADRPTVEEIMDRLSKLPPIELIEPAAVTIRRVRDASDPRDVE